MKVALGLLLLSCLLLFACLVEGGKNKKNTAGEDGDNACVQSIKKNAAMKRKICDLERRLQILESEEEEEEEEEETEMVGQWVQQVTNFSSQYNTGGFSAAQIVGEPNVYPTYGDFVGAWAQSRKETEEFVEVKFAVSVVPQMFSIYETFHAGGVYSIEARNPDGGFEKIIDDLTPQVIKHARIFNVTIPNASFAADTYRIYVNCFVEASRKWVEIDAIQLFS